MSIPGPQPTISEFQTFLTNIVGVPTDVLPANSPVITYSFDGALNSCSQQLALIPSQSTAWSIYQSAVYNLGAAYLIDYAQDAPSAPVYKDGLPYFAWLRKQFNINNFVAGVIQSSSDEGTSQSLVVPEAFKNLTISQLQLLKTPYGRSYLGWAQSLGTLWGLS